MSTQDVVAQKWKAITGKPIVEGYGLSETSPIVTCNQPTIAEFSGAIGYPVPSTEVSIRTPEGELVPLGERGELCVKGPQVMARLLAQAGRDRESHDQRRLSQAPATLRSWLPDGLIKIVDRLKDMILVSGFNVYPNEVENPSWSNIPR